MLFVDEALARRLERAEGAVASRIIEARGRLDPAKGSVWREIAGAFALFDGPDSPITQVFGLGTSGPVGAAEVAAIEAFFGERGAAACHELSPLAGVATYALLAERGYRPIELSNVLVRDLSDASGDGSLRGATVREATADEEPAWVETAVAGWAETGEAARMIRGFMQAAFASDGTVNYFARIDGIDVATAAMGMHDGIALLAGASTLPSARKRGAQRALLAARLVEAKRRGCAVAMMAAAPGSTSQRNAERNGFRVAYTRTKWGGRAPATARLAPE